MPDILKIFLDPLDPEQTNNSFQTLVGFSNKEYRTDFLKIFNNTNIYFYDLYRDPEVLLPIIFQIPSYFIFLDYKTYMQIESKIIARLSSQEAHTMVPIAVYFAETDLLDNRFIFNVNKSHDEMLDCFMACHKQAKNAFINGSTEHISITGNDSPSAVSICRPSRILI